ncbi:MAG TPA: hypothetical protein VN803_04040 [Gemmatimonadales bacterium]|nr:hypothetical protein [Gemmatimonadales bacterium]
MVQCHVPDYLHEGLIEYLASRRPVGHFLTAVLSNDLMEASVRADPLTRYFLVDVVLFLVNYAPATAWGSADKVSAWLAAVDEPVPEVFE